MTTSQDYGIRKTVDLSYEAAIERAREVLKEEGFGVLTEIDMRAKFKEKLGVDSRPYMILGACNPPLAHKAVQAEPEIGLLLPCNVIVYVDEEGKTVVSAMDPRVIVTVVRDNPVMDEVAKDARARLEKAIAAL